MLRLMLRSRPKLILQIIFLLTLGGGILGDSKKASSTRQLSADSKPSIDSVNSDLFESELKVDLTREDGSAAKKHLDDASKLEVKAETSTSKAGVEEPEKSAGAKSDLSEQTGLLTTAEASTGKDPKTDVEAKTAVKEAPVSSPPSSPPSVQGSGSKSKKTRRKDSGEMVSLDAGFRDPDGKQKVVEVRVVPKEIQEHMREEEDSKDGLLTEYGLIFLISAGSLGIVAASLLGLSVAFSKSSKSDNCCIPWCSMRAGNGKGKMKRSGSSSKWVRQERRIATKKHRSSRMREAVSPR
eukprot:jgi/Bigna1/146214/aug1.110_g20922